MSKLTSSKTNIDFATKEIVIGMQSGAYTLTAAYADVGNGFEITIPKTGRYRISCQFTAYIDFTTNQQNGIAYYLDNAGVIAGTYGRTSKWDDTSGLEVGQLNHVVAPIQLFNAGDVIKLRAYKINTDPAYITYGTTFVSEADGYLQAEMIDAYVPAIHEDYWQSYALTIGAITTPPTKGTMQADIATWRRVGANMELMYNYRQSVAGGAGSGYYLFPLPGGYNIDTTLLETIVDSGGYYNSGHVGSGTCWNGANSYPVTAHAYDANNIVLQYGSAASTIGSGAMSLNSAAILIISYKASVPIVGWS